MSSTPRPDSPIEEFIDGANGGRALMAYDNDGSLSPIVPDFRKARPLPEAVEVLHAIAATDSIVAVVSGRPAGLLRDWYQDPDSPAEDSRVIYMGLYGRQRSEGGEVETHPVALAGAPRVAAAYTSAKHRFEGTGIMFEYEEKDGLALVLHTREVSVTDPKKADRLDAEIETWAQQAAAVHQLKLDPGKRIMELSIPGPFDKGEVISELFKRYEGITAASYLGDDKGDIPAFEKLEELRELGIPVLRTLVDSPEAPTRLRELADVLVDSPQEAVRLSAYVGSRIHPSLEQPFAKYLDVCPGFWRALGSVDQSAITNTSTS